MGTLQTDFFNKLSKYVSYTSLDEMNYAVYVSLKHKYVYVETAKVACSSIKLTLQRLELEDKSFKRDTFQDIHNRQFSPLLKLQQIPRFEKLMRGDDFFRFCFVRNPYTRTLSAYLDKIKGNSTREKSKVLSQLGYDTQDMSIPISFDQFVTALEEQPILKMDNHWRHQYYSTYQDTIRYNFIGKLERFSEDFSFVMKKLGAQEYYKQEFRHATNSISKLREYYTDDLLNRVYCLYKLDFETFGYDKKEPFL